jgi:hypothetical protein
VIGNNSILSFTFALPQLTLRQYPSSLGCAFQAKQSEDSLYFFIIKHCYCHFLFDLAPSEVGNVVDFKTFRRERGLLFGARCWIHTHPLGGA